MPNVTLKISQENNLSIVELTGSIDENFNLYTNVIPKEGAVEFSLEGLKSINSMGIREWIKALQGLSKAKISFSHCPKIFIDQVNMVSGFIPAGSKVISFYVPYYNEASEVETLVLYKLGEDYTNTSVKIQEEYKDNKGQVFELDVVKAKYFKFIQAN